MKKLGRIYPTRPQKGAPLQRVASHSSDRWISRIDDPGFLSHPEFKYTKLASEGSVVVSPLLIFPISPPFALTPAKSTNANGCRRKEE